MDCSRVGGDDSDRGQSSGMFYFTPRVSSLLG